jgi:hypothetical protein
MYRIVDDALGWNGARYYILGFVGVYLLIVASMGLRIIGDVLEFWRPKKDAASELITASNSLLIITISLKVGIDIFSYNFGFLPMSIFPVVLFFVVLIAFQTETTRLKLREKKRTPKGKTENIRERHTDTIEISENKSVNQGSNYSTP